MAQKPWNQEPPWGCSGERGSYLLSILGKSCWFTSIMIDVDCRCPDIWGRWFMYTLVHRKMIYEQNYWTLPWGGDHAPKGWCHLAYLSSRAPRRLELVSSQLILWHWSRENIVGALELFVYPMAMATKISHRHNSSSVYIWLTLTIVF